MATTTTAADRLGYVTLGDDGMEWPARFDPTQRWNGWLCPRFRLKDVLTIAAVVNRDPAVDFIAEVRRQVRELWRRWQTRNAKM